MKHSGSFAIRRGMSSSYIAPSKFEKPSHRTRRGLNNYQVQRLIEGKKVYEVSAQCRRNTSL